VLHIVDLPDLGFGGENQVCAILRLHLIGSLFVTVSQSLLQLVGSPV
jgi:hypothetical protein